MLLRISHTAIDHHTQCPEILRPGRHQSTPAGRGQPLGLLDVHDVALFVGVSEMHRGRGAGALRFDHLHRDRRPIDACAGTWGVHLQPIQEATVRLLELDQRIADLEWSRYLANAGTRHAIRSAYVADGEALEALKGLRDGTHGEVKIKKGSVGARTYRVPAREFHHQYRTSLAMIE